MATINAASADTFAVQAAMDLAVDGDTVVVPAGTYESRCNLTMAATKGLQVIGAGIGSTNYTMTHDALTVYCTHPTATSATVTTTTTAITLTYTVLVDGVPVDTTQTYTTTQAAYDTVTEVVNAINGLTYWVAAVVGGRGSYQSYFVAASNGCLGLANIRTIQVGHVVTIYPRATNSRVRWSGFSYTTVQAGVMQINDYTVGATNWRIDHCSWTNGVLGTQFNIHGYTFGVVDNCTFTNCLRTTWQDQQVRPQDVTAPYDYPGGYSWKQPVDMGGPSHVYFEDCTFTNSTSSIVHNMRGGARCVFRHCTFNGIQGLETHSGCTPGYRNPRWFEFYENTLDLQGGSYWCGLFLRSTNGMVFNNTFSAGYSLMIRFDNETTCISCTAGPWPTANRTVYPTQDQIGAGLDSGYGSAQSTTEAKLRFWNNTLGGVNTAPSNTACAMIAENRDFWQQVTPFTGTSGIGVGTLTKSELPQSSAVGVCYWNTNENILYRVNSGGVWEDYYIPYTYPHPIRGESAGDVTAAAHAASSTSTIGQATVVRTASGEASDYLENKVLNHVFRVSTFTMPTHIYVALCKSTIEDTHTGSTLPSEVSGAGYARTLCDDWTSAVDGHIDNENAVVFPAATEDWGTITDIAMCDAETGGNVLTYGKLYNYKDVVDGDIMEFEAGSLDVTLA